MFLYTLKKKWISLLMSICLMLLGFFTFFTSPLDNLLFFLLRSFCGCIMVMISGAMLSSIFSMTEGRKSRMKIKPVPLDDFFCSSEMKDRGFKKVEVDGFTFVCQGANTISNNCVVAPVGDRRCPIISSFFGRLAPVAKAIERNERESIPLLHRSMVKEKQIVSLNADRFEDDAVVISITNELDDLYSNRAAGKQIVVMDKVVSSTLDFMPAEKDGLIYNILPLKQSCLANGLRIAYIVLTNDGYVVSEEIAGSMILCRYDKNHLTIKGMVMYTLTKLVESLRLLAVPEILGYARSGQDAFAPVIACTTELPASKVELICALQKIAEGQDTIVNDSDFIQKENFLEREAASEGHALCKYLMIRGD